MTTPNQFRHRRRTTARRRPVANRRNQSNRFGVTAVEFALVANVMFISIFACIEFARVNMVRNMSQNAAYYAARTAMVPGATEADAKAEVDRLLGSLISTGYTTQVSELGNDASTIEVRVEVDLRAVALFVPMFVTDPTLTSVATLRTERYSGFYQQ